MNLEERIEGIELKGDESTAVVTGCGGDGTVLPNGAAVSRQVGSRLVHCVRT